MSKKILSIIVTICLVSTVLSTASLSIKGADEHFHCVCGKTNCSGTGHDPTQQWEMWTTDNDLPSDDGYYYLTCDVEMSMSWDLYKQDIHLCLNGHTIKIENDEDYGIQTKKDSYLVITNCENEGSIISDSDVVISATSNSNVTLNNVTINGDVGSSIIEVGENSTLVANNIESTCEIETIKDAVTNYGTSTFNECDFNVTTKSNTAVIYNHGGNLTTNNTTIYLDGMESYGQENRAVMNSDGIWYSNADDIVADDDDIAFGIENNGSAKTVIDESHVKGNGANEGYGLEIGFKGIDDEDTIYVCGDANIEGSTSSIIQSRNAGLFASNEDKTKSFTGSDATIKYVKDNPQVGDVLVQNANESMVSVFSVIYPANTYLKLSGTNLVTTNESPTTTVTTTEAPTTTVGPSQSTSVQPTSGQETTKGQEVSTEKETIKPVVLKKVKKGKKSAKVYWKKLSSKDANGYQIRYSLKKSMKKAKKKLVNKVKKGSIKIKKLKRKKRYYFQIRAYKDVLGKRLYSVWSKKKSVKVK